MAWRDLLSTRSLRIAKPNEDDMSSRTGSHHLFSLTIALAWATFSGCGGGDEGRVPTVRVSGTLTVDGKPVNKGTVHFVPAAGPSATGIVQDGKFTLTTYTDGDGGIPGKNLVSVEVVEEVPTKDGDTTAKSLIPVKFMNPDTSGIQFELRPAGYSNLQIMITGSSGSIKED
jgi:hypothetical protein